MGSSSSPAFASRVGNSFLCRIQQKFGTYSGVGTANCFWSSFEELGYNPDHWYGFILTNQYGIVVKLLGFVDDFLIYGWSLQLCSQGLTMFLDFAVDYGCLAHPDKLIQPSQQVSYVDFLLNSVHQPNILPQARTSPSYGWTSFVLPLSHRVFSSQLSSSSRCPGIYCWSKAS